MAKGEERSARGRCREGVALPAPPLDWAIGQEPLAQLSWQSTPLESMTATDAFVAPSVCSVYSVVKYSGVTVS